MKLQIGKRYKRRDGQIIRINRVFDNFNHDKIFEAQGDHHKWFENGVYDLYTETELDLIEELPDIIDNNTPTKISAKDLRSSMFDSVPKETKDKVDKDVNSIMYKIIENQRDFEIEYDYRYMNGKIGDKVYIQLVVEELRNLGYTVSLYGDGFKSGLHISW